MDDQLPTGTKHEILKLLVREERSAYGLAEALGVSAAAVRQHLETLEALGLVVKRKAVTQPSRPTFLYRLSRAGARAFPKRYALLLTLLVGALIERDGPTAMLGVVSAAARRLAAPFYERFRQVGKRERWALLVDWLQEQLEWEASVSEDGDQHRVTIHHCPFQDVSKEHPEICGLFFTTLIHALYGNVPVEQAPTPFAAACCALLVGGQGR